MSVRTRVLRVLRSLAAAGAIVIALAGCGGEEFDFGHDDGPRQRALAGSARAYMAAWNARDWRKICSYFTNGVKQQVLHDAEINGIAVTDCPQTTARTYGFNVNTFKGLRIAHAHVDGRRGAVAFFAGDRPGGQLPPTLRFVNVRGRWKVAEI